MVGGGEWLTIGEVAAALSISDTTAREYLDAGRLDDPVKAVRLPSGHRRAHRDSVERLRLEIYGNGHGPSLSPGDGQPEGSTLRRNLAEDQRGDG